MYKPIIYVAHIAIGDDIPDWCAPPSYHKCKWYFVRGRKNNGPDYIMWICSTVIHYILIIGSLNHYEL